MDHGSMENRRHHTVVVDVVACLAVGVVAIVNRFQGLQRSQLVMCLEHS